jgi:hypothetical protein
MLLLAAIVPDDAHAALDGLSGCWSAVGEVEGKAVKNIARGTWRFGERYFLLDLHGLDPADPYDAAIVIGDHDVHRLSAWWMDSFGAGYSARGEGEVTGGRIEIRYAYPDAIFVNRLTPLEKSWRWEIVARAGDGKEMPFASYQLSPIACTDPGQFAF